MINIAQNTTATTATVTIAGHTTPIANTTTRQDFATTHLLHRQFVQLGRERNKITYKLLSLLPKIYKQKIYASEGYATIYEYAGKLAGLSHSVVEKTLKLENKLQNKPHLQKAIETQGIHKVALVANLATSQTDLFFADKVENMSKSALVVLGKELREANSQKMMNLAESSTITTIEHAKSKMKIELDDEMEFLFLKLKKEMKAKELSNKEFLRRILKKMTATSQMMAKRPKTAATSQSAPNFPGKKLDKNAKTLHGNTSKKAVGEQKQSSVQKLSYRSKQTVALAWPGKSTNTFNRITRYIRVITRRAAIQITNGKCAHEGCNKPYDVLHHVERFAAGGSHESIIPLCKEHHEFAHNGLLKEDTQNNRGIDEKYRKCRRQVLYGMI